MSHLNCSFFLDPIFDIKTKSKEPDIATLSKQKPLNEPETYGEQKPLDQDNSMPEDVSGIDLLI